MTQDSGFSTLLDPGGIISLNTYTYKNKALADPDPANTYGGFRPLITAVPTGQAITASNTGIPRLWIWSILTYYYVTASNNFYQPGASTYATFNNSVSRYSAGIPTELQNLIDNPGTEPGYQYIVLSIEWRSSTAPLLKNDENRPSYYSLVGGYGLDNRYPLEQVTIIPSVTKLVTLEYYRLNPLEPIPNLKSIDWHVQSLQIFEGVAITIKLSNCVLGTLYCDDHDTRLLIINTVGSTSYYSPKYFFPEHLSELFQAWMSLYANSNNNTNPNNLAIYPETRLIRRLAANNNYWNNATLNTDLNFDINHPMFVVDNQRAYDWHINPQLDGSTGNLIMDSLRTIETNQRVSEIYNALQASNYLLETPAIIGTGTAENPQVPAKHRLDYYIVNGTNSSSSSPKLDQIHKALDAGKFAVNELDNTKSRVTNLGFLIDNLARVNGLRFDPNGDIDLAKEKDLYQPRTLNDASLGLSTSEGKYNDYSLSCWGKIGMIVPHLPTQYNQNGKPLELWDVVHDNQQLALALFRQQDISLSIQHGSEIRVNGLDSKIHCYPNQLAVLLECLQRLEKISYITEKNFLVSTVAGTEVRELFSGIGIPVTQKFMPLKDPKNSKKVLSVPYFGHQKNKPSTAQMLTTVQINLAVINGVLMPKKQPKASITNPFKYFTPNK